MRFLLFILGFGLSICFSRAQSQVDTVTEYLRHTMVDRHIPGMQLKVIKHGETVYSFCFGIANVEDSLSISDSTVFPTHSITKSIVAAAVLQLVEKGSIRLLDSIGKFIPGLTPQFACVTVLQLMTHTSGLPDCWDANDNPLDVDEDVAWTKLLFTSPLDQPGKRIQFSQINFVLLGRMIEAVSGLTLSQFISTYQFHPLGIVRAGFSDSRKLVPAMAKDYWFYRCHHDTKVKIKSMEINTLNYPDYMFGAVGLHASCSDLSKWILGLKNGTILSKKYSDLMWYTSGFSGGAENLGTQVGKYSPGWFVDEINGHLCYISSGGDKGIIEIFPKEDLTLVVMTNLVASDPQSILDHILPAFDSSF